MSPAGTDRRIEPRLSPGATLSAPLPLPRSWPLMVSGQGDAHRPLEIGDAADECFIGSATPVSGPDQPLNFSIEH